jgi:hypothetical protein
MPITVKSQARALAAMVAILLAAGSCKERKTASATASVPAVPASAGPSALAPLPSSPIERRKMLAATYRPGPDRRVLRALRDVQRIVTGKEVAEDAKAVFDGKVWIVTIADREVARLSEIPTFDESLAAAVALAKESEKARPLELGGPATPSSPERALPFDEKAFELAVAAQDAWAKAPTRGALHDAARALVAMAMQMTDEMQLADDVPARALAVVAIDKALGGGPTASLEIMLATALGYRASAIKIAASIPAADPNRQYVLRDDAALAAAAKAPNAPEWTRYLWYRRILVNNDHPGEVSFRLVAFPDSGLSLPLLGHRRYVDDLAVQRDASLVFPPAVLLATGRAAGAPDAVKVATKVSPKQTTSPAATGGTIRAALAADRGTTLVRFDRDLLKVGSTDKGPFVDAELRRSYLRAFMYSAQQQDGLLELEWYSSPPRAKAFLDALAPSTSRESNDFRAWYQVLVALAQAGDAAAAVPHLGAPSAFGLWPRVRLFRAVEQRSSSVGGVSNATRYLAPFFDTRPTALSTLGDIAWTGLSDIRLAEKYTKAAVDEGPHLLAQRLWLARRTTEEPMLRAILNDETNDAESRLDALGALEALGKASASAADAETDRILASSNDGWPPRWKATSYLLRHGRYSRVRSISEDWLSRHEDTPGLDAVGARCQIALSFAKEKRHAEALGAVKPALASWAATPMQIAASMNARLGHRAEAEKLAGDLLERYPEWSSVGAGVGVRWIGRDYDHAADLLVHPPKSVPRRQGDWHKLGEMFDTAFAGAPNDASKALDALFAKGARVEDAQGLMWYAYLGRDFEIAWTVALRAVSMETGTQRLRNLVTAYTVLRDWKGEPAALAWLRPQVKPGELAAFADAAIGGGEEALVWSIVPDSGGDFDKLWVLRGVSAHRTKAVRSKLPLVRAHYEADAGGGAYWSEIGKYLAGLSDDATVAALAHDPQTIAEVSFYMGARAEGEGRYEDANDYYRSAVEAGGKGYGEVNWARLTLNRWKRYGVTLSRVGEQPFPAHSDVD